MSKQKIHLIMSGVLGRYGCHHGKTMYLGHALVYPEIFKLIPTKHRCRLCQRKDKK